MLLVNGRKMAMECHVGKKGSTIKKTLAWRNEAKSSNLEWFGTLASINTNFAQGFETLDLAMALKPTMNRGRNVA